MFFIFRNMTKYFFTKPLEGFETLRGVVIRDNVAELARISNPREI